MNVLVTGAGGFLGRHVVRELLARGHDVRAMIRPSKPISPQTFPEFVEVVRADLRSRSQIAECLSGVDAVVHLAACVTGDEESQIVNTVVGTENLLKVVQQQRIRRLVHCSSFSVYDWNATGRALSEQTPLEQDLYSRDTYAVAKTWQERLVRRFGDAGDGVITILRPGFIWGCGNELPACLGMSIGRCYVVFGGVRSIPLTYVENCADCFAVALNHPSARGATFNVVDGHSVSAWTHTGRALRAQGGSQRRLYVPNWMGLSTARVATWVSRMIFRGKGKLPGILMPNRYRARFRVWRFPNRGVVESLGWTPPWTYQEAWQRVDRAGDFEEEPVEPSAPVSVPPPIAAHSVVA
jgi:UDP-glucose 4-epimerase